ncbi:MAG: hypothetical protein EOP83_03640 [Verrucomicrobiaceae bacterium]|nr:MAG: hypothetical protein EOP83_03640 [Verrucomicrobiaceae bacterium]
MTKFERGTYGSVSFTRMGLRVEVFDADESRLLTGWCIRIGGNVYDGFESRRDAVEGVSKFI